MLREFPDFHPLSFLMTVASNKGEKMERRIDAAKHALPYLERKLSESKIDMVANVTLESVLSTIANNSVQAEEPEF